VPGCETVMVPGQWGSGSQQVSIVALPNRRRRCCPSPFLRGSTLRGKQRRIPLSFGMVGQGWDEPAGDDASGKRTGSSGVLLCPYVASLPGLLSQSGVRMGRSGAGRIQVAVPWASLRFLIAEILHIIARNRRSNCPELTTIQWLL